MNETNNQGNPLPAGQQPEQVAPPEGSQDKPLSREEVRDMVAEGIETGFRRAQGHTDAVKAGFEKEVAHLKSLMGVEKLSPEQEQRVRDKVVKDIQDQPPQNSGQESAQTPPGSEASLDPVSQKALDKQKAKGVFFAENDPELAALKRDGTEDEYLASVDNALNAKIKRLASPESPPVERTPTSLGGGGSQSVETYGEKSMDEAYKDAGF